MTKYAMLFAAIISPLAAASEVVAIQVPCVPTDAAIGFLNESQASNVALEVFEGGKLIDHVWVTPDRMFVLRTNKATDMTCVLTEVPLKGDI